MLCDRNCDDRGVKGADGPSNNNSGAGADGNGNDHQQQPDCMQGSALGKACCLSAAGHSWPFLHSHFAMSNTSNWQSSTESGADGHIGDAREPASQIFKATFFFLVSEH